MVEMIKCIKYLGEEKNYLLHFEKKKIIYILYFHFFFFLYNLSVKEGSSVKKTKK